jgi:hypothetical protein
MVSDGRNVIAGQTTAAIQLLPTNREADRLRSLEDALENRTGDTTSNYAELKTIVQDFVVRQLQAAPAISDDSLREQLRKLIGRTWAELPDGGLYVKSDTSWGSVQSSESGPSRTSSGLAVTALAGLAS